MRSLTQLAQESLISRSRIENLQLGMSRTQLQSGGGGSGVEGIVCPVPLTGHGSDLDAFFVSIEYLTNNRPEVGFDTDRWNLYVN